MPPPRGGAWRVIFNSMLTSCPPRMGPKWDRTKKGAQTTINTMVLGTITQCPRILRGAGGAWRTQWLLQVYQSDPSEGGGGGPRLILCSRAGLGDPPRIGLKWDRTKQGAKTTVNITILEPIQNISDFDGSGPKAGWGGSPGALRLRNSGTQAGWGGSPGVLRLRTSRTSRTSGPQAG